MSDDAFQRQMREINSQIRSAVDRAMQEYTATVAPQDDDGTFQITTLATQEQP